MKAKEEAKEQYQSEEYSVKPKRKIPIKTTQVIQSKPEERPDEPAPIIKDL